MSNAIFNLTGSFKAIIEIIYKEGYWRIPKGEELPELVLPIPAFFECHNRNCNMIKWIDGLAVGNERCIHTLKIFERESLKIRSELLYNYIVVWKQFPIFTIFNDNIYVIKVFDYLRFDNKNRDKMQDSLGRSISPSRSIRNSIQWNVCTEQINEFRKDLSTEAPEVLLLGHKANFFYYIELDEAFKYKNWGYSRPMFNSML